MAEIKITKKWDDNERLRKVEFELIGEGDIEVPYSFMHENDKRYARVEFGQTLYIGPFKLWIIAQSKNINGSYICKVVEE